jgi:hypothetical protein
MDERIGNSWSTALPLIQRILNATVNKTTKVTPAAMLFGGVVNLNRNLLKTEPVAAVEVSAPEYVSNLIDLQKIILNEGRRNQGAAIESRLDDSPLLWFVTSCHTYSSLDVIF